MERSATEIMQDAIVASVLDAIVAWKAASGGLANVLARDLGAVHPNTTLADLPKEVQSAIVASTRAAFNRLLKDGYSVAKGAPAPRPQVSGARPPRGDTPPRGPRGPGKSPVFDPQRGPRGGGRGGPSRGR